MRRINAVLTLFVLLFLLDGCGRTTLAPKPVSGPGAEPPICREQNTAETPDTPVWRWFGPCSSRHTLRAEVFLDCKSIYRTSFPLCAMRRSEIVSERPAKILEFHFEADTTIFDAEFKASGHHIEGNIWSAGSDPDCILLGISFQDVDDGNRGLLNTIHIAPPDKASQSTLASGLVIQTYPVGVE